MKYRIDLSNVPDGVYVETYICGRSNGDGSPNAARREFSNLRQAQRVVREFRTAKRAHPEDFEPDMDAEIVRVA